MKQTASIHIQDIELCRNAGFEYFKMSIILNGIQIDAATNVNPGVWYIQNPLRVKVGDVSDGQWEVIDIIEYPPQPTCRTLKFVHV